MLILEPKICNETFKLVLANFAKIDCQHTSKLLRCLPYSQDYQYFPSVASQLIEQKIYFCYSCLQVQKSFSGISKHQKKVSSPIHLNPAISHIWLWGRGINIYIYFLDRLQNSHNLNNNNNNNNNNKNGFNAIIVKEEQTKCMHSL